MLIPYVRQSRKKEVTISIRDQLQSILAWASANNIELAEPIVEQGVSGSKNWRERALGEAVARCERGEASGVIVAFQDRLSREQSRGTMEVWESLERAGARLVCAGEGLDTATGDHEMLFTIKAAIAREQWKRHAINWSNAQRDAVEGGQHLAAHVPVGYVRNVVGHHPTTGKPIHGSLLLDPVVSPVIRELFELRAAGGTWTECAWLFERREVLNHKGTVYWQHATLQRLVKNRVYMGEAHHGRFVNPEAHDAIVEPALWRAAQPKPQSNVRQPAETALLASVLRCANCGKPLSYVKARGTYRCVKGRNTQGDCTSPANVRAPEIEPLIEQAFLSNLPLHLLPPAASDVDLRPLEQELTNARTAYTRWLELDISDIDPGAFREGVVTRKARVDAAEDALRVASAEHEQSREQLMLLQTWSTLTTPEKRRWLMNFGVRVEVQRGNEPVTQRTRMSMERTPADPTTVAGNAAERYFSLSPIEREAIEQVVVPS